MPQLIKRNRILLVATLIAVIFSGCSIFKKGCDCPPVGKKRSALNTEVPFC